MRLNICLVLASYIFQASYSVSEYEYDYIDNEEFQPNEQNHPFYENEYDDIQEYDDDIQEYNKSYEPSEYNNEDTMPLGDLSDSDRITIQQFVNELKRRKLVKEQQKLKKVSQQKSKKNQNIEKKKEKQKVMQNSKTSSASKPNVSKAKKTSTQRNENKKISESKGVNKSKMAKAKTSKTKNQRKSKTIPVPKPAKNKDKSKKKKPFHRPKKTNDREEEDFFQIGNSGPLQHRDHHIHHHDHLEGHKHHHKHKESHSHSHDHANDHVHNHKHTHNHEHNHIHKHNEAHEHSAEHTHTEKHHHKHLEYIDAGGWRRRNDESRQTILETEPVQVILEGRSLKEYDPKDNMKNYIKKFIEFYKTATKPVDDYDDKDIAKPFELADNNAFSQFNDDNFPNIDAEFDYFNFDIKEPSREKPLNSQISKHQLDLVFNGDGKEYLDNFALKKEGEEFDKEYSSNDDSEDGIQKLNNYSEYDDQTGYGSTNTDATVQYTDILYI